MKKPVLLYKRIFSLNTPACLTSLGIGWAVKQTPKGEIEGFFMAEKKIKKNTQDGLIAWFQAYIDREELRQIRGGEKKTEFWIGKKSGLKLAIETIRQIKADGEVPINGQN